MTVASAVAGPGAAATGAAVAGPVLFARFAYPPNSLGYCGPADAEALRGYATAGVPGRGLVALARQFAGAWPYLCLIGAASGRADPLDTAVVDAYWVGNRLLDRVPARLFAAHLADRFEDQARSMGRRGFDDLATLAVLGAVPHHNFHVFAVYPWVGMLRAGYAEEPLRVLNSCRVRWGRVVAVRDAVAEVAAQPLAWDGRALRLGPPRTEWARVASVAGGGTLAPAVRAGDVVALHWDWVCDVLAPRRLEALRRYTGRLLRLTNTALARPPATAVLD